MIRILHQLKELARNLYRNSGTALASLLSLTLLFLLFDIYWIGASTSNKFYSNLISEIRMEAFISESVPDSAIAKLSNNAQIIEGVMAVDFISKDLARLELSRLVGSDLLVGYDSLNPLPRSFVLSFLEDALVTKELTRIEQQLIGLGGIDEVYYSQRWLTKAETAREMIRIAGLALGALILLTALISSTNNIRLMTRTRTDGFRQMRLLGVSKLFLALPFLLEGMIISGLAAVLGWGVIFYIRQRITLAKIEIIYPDQDQIFIFCAITALLGMISGYVGIRKMLRRR